MAIKPEVMARELKMALDHLIAAFFDFKSMDRLSRRKYRKIVNSVQFNGMHLAALRAADIIDKYGGTDGDA